MCRQCDFTGYVIGKGTPCSCGVLERGKLKDAEDTIAAQRQAIKNLLDIIHDDLTHERQRDHAEAIAEARRLIGKE